VGWREEREDPEPWAGVRGGLFNCGNLNISKLKKISNFYLETKKVDNKTRIFYRL
jgi:hypothetical protein